MESSSTDALVGPTFADIIADQFSRFRKGDRYFFEHSPDINPGAFTEQQLQQLRLTTMSRIICDNADGYALSSVPPLAFKLPHVHGYVSLIECVYNASSAKNVCFRFSEMLQSHVATQYRFRRKITAIGRSEPFVLLVLVFR